MLRMGGMIATMGILLSGCQPTELNPNEGDADGIERGRLAAIEMGCAACHSMPGIAWPAGRTGPDLINYGRQALIAGSLPNRPENLAAFVKNAPSLVPGTAMPAIVMTDQQAQDIASWLQNAK